MLTLELLYRNNSKISAKAPSKQTKAVISFQGLSYALSLPLRFPLGCILVFGFYATHPFRPRAGEALSHRREVRLGEEVLYRDHRGQCNTALAATEHV